MRQVLGSEVPVEDPGFRHGLGVFETVRVVEGKAILADWHWESLCEAAGAIGLEAPISFPLDLPPGKEGLWRWFHTESGIRATWDERNPEIPDSLALRLSTICHSSQAWTSRYKTLSYLGNLQAKQMAGGAEALLLNEHGRVATAAMANVFWVREGVLFTPSRDCGCRAGVIRRWVLEQGGIECREVSATVEDLMAAQEIFLTNSRVGILPVCDLEGQAFQPGEAMACLRERYSACLTPAEE